MSVLQGANYIFPLITLPYLVRVLGADKYGLLAFASVTVAYFNVLTDFGFNLTAPRELAVNRDNLTKISEIFSAVISIKFILLFVSIICLTVLVFSFERFSRDWEIYYISFGLVVGQTLFPVWFFQGMEEMKYITWLNLLTRSILTVAIFTIIRTQNDYYLVPIIQSAGAIVSSFVGFYIIRNKFRVRFQILTIRVMFVYMSEAYHLFISNIAISLYTISTTFILGLFANNTVVGYFTAANRIIQAVKGLTGPVSQSIYPYIAKRVSRSASDGIRFIRKIVKYMAGATGMISLSIFFFAGPIVHLLLGHQYENSIVVLRIMSILPFLIGMSNIFGIQTMLTFNRKKPFSKIYIAGGLLSLLISLILVPIYHQIGSAVSVVMVETYITLAMFVYLQRNGLSIV